MRFSRHTFVPVVSWVLVVALAGCAGTDDPGPPNSAPNASVTVEGSGTVIVGDSVTLDASATTDPDGDDVRIRWAVTTPEGSAVTMQGAVGEMQTITPDVPGAYQITVTAADEFTEDTASTVLTATAPENRAPQANAGESRNADRGTNVVLDGNNSSDPDGDELSFAWEFDSTPSSSTAELRNVQSATPSFTPDEDGTYVIALTVTDPDGLSDTDTVSIAVGTDNAHPIADAGDNINTEPNTTVTLTGSGSSDPDGDGLTYAWSIESSPDGSSPTLSGETMAQAQLTVDIEGAYEVELEVTDTGDLSATDTVIVNVSTDNQPPVARFSVPSEVTVGDTIVLDGRNSTDPEGASLSYNWDVTDAPDTTNPSSSTGEIVEVDVFFEGSYTVELTVEDSGGLTDTASRTFSGVPAPTPVAPSASGDLIITEVMYNPDQIGDASGEWFELHNPSGSEAYELQNCEVSDLGTDSYNIGSSVTVGPGEYVTLAKGANPGFSPDFVFPGDFYVGNSDDELILTCGGTEIDQLAYDSSFAGGAGVSAQLNPNFFNSVDNDTLSNWCDSTSTYNGDKGTPGGTNDGC